MRTTERTTNSVLARLGWRPGALLCTLLWTYALFAQSPPPSNDSEPQISVRISAEKTRLRLREDIPLHIEIWNIGKQDIFIFKDIQAAFYNELAYLDLTLYYGNQADRPIGLNASDCFCSERSSYPPLESELPRYWIAIPPQHYYGGEVVMRASLFRKLSVPGKYRIQGKYKSRGFLAQDINNPLLHYAEELNKLPYKAWVGEVETNSVWIEVTNRDGRPKRGNSPPRHFGRCIVQQ